MGSNKYFRWKESIGLEAIRRLAEEGFSDEEIAVRSRLGMNTFRRWKRNCPEFAAALELGRSGSDYEVIKALYKKAVGYNVSLNKTYKLKRVDYDPDTGKKIREYEELATGVDENYVPADLRAETFWLKNRQPERWSDRHERSSGDGDGDCTGVIEIPEADSIDEYSDEAVEYASGMAESDG